jgi:hypothetical protein
MKKRNRPVGNRSGKTTSKKVQDNLVLFPGSEEAPELDFSARLKLTVSATGATKKKIESYLKKSFKSLEAVELTDSEPHYWISVIGEIDNSFGFSISYLIAGMYPTLKHNISGVLDEDGAEMFADMFDEFCTVFEHQMKIGPPQMFKSACEEIVQHFDEEYLQGLIATQKLMMNMMMEASE